MESSFQGKEREVWEALRKLNDAWTKGDGKDLENFFHKDMAAITPTDRNRREGREDCVAGWVGFLSITKIHRWEEVDPKISTFRLYSFQGTGYQVHATLC